MPKLAQIAQLRVTSKGAGRDLVPTGGAQSIISHTFPPEAVSVIPDSRAGVINPLCVKIRP